MKRITGKKKVCVGITKEGDCIEQEFIAFKDIDLAYKKLYELENIEEEFGIDLITLFRNIDKL